MINLIERIEDILILFRKKPWPLQKPRVIQFPVNDICNARCQMCHIWQQKLDYQISPFELEKALENSLFTEVRAVGVNGGEPTLRKDLAKIVDILFRKLPKLKGIALITNAFVYKNVIARIAEVGKVVRDHRGSFGVMVSLDGVAEVHDRVRGRKGSFQNAVKVIDFIKECDLITNCRLGCTVIKENVYGLHDLLDFAIEKGIYIKFRLGVPHQRLYTQDMSEPFALSFEEKVHFCGFLESLTRYYERSAHQNFFYRSLIDQLMHGEPRKAGCAWQHRGVTISARGELLYCAVQSHSLGSIVDEDSKKLYFENHDHLSEIVENKCANCKHDYMGLLPGPVLLKHYLARASEKVGIPADEIKNHKLLAPINKLVQRRRFCARLKRLAANGYGAKCPVRNLKPLVNRSGKSCRVMICGWYGTETLGDKAILCGVVSSIRKFLGEVSFYLVSLEPYISRITVNQMPELSGTVIVNTEKGISLAKNMNLIVFGGGPLMALDNLAEMIAIFEQAAEHGVPAMIAGCGVGPFGAGCHNKAIKRLLELASIRIYRDLKSKDYASTLGVDVANDFVAEDPAFTWLVEKGKAESVGCPNDNACLSLILGLRDWPYQQYAPELPADRGGELKKKFEEEVVSALYRLIDRYSNIKIIPYPMCTNHFGGDDRWFYRRLFRGHADILKAVDRSVMSYELSPHQALKVFSAADVALTMRFHSLVFAVGTGTPAVAIDYTLGRGKVAGFASAYGIPHMSLDRINAEFIVRGIESAAKNKSKFNAVIHNLKHVFPQVLSKAMEDLR